MSPDPNPPGYELLGLLGQTPAGAVYRARDLAVGQEVAIKLLRAGSATTDTRRRFLDEARILGQLQHPGVPPVYALGELPDGLPFVVMKLIRGDTLDNLLRERPAPSLPQLLAVFEQLCQTVAYAHARRVIHRDIKPGNVMIGAFGEVLVMDWGLAKVLGAPDAAGGPQSESVPGTAIRSVMGTPAFMPPELARGEIDKLDERVDVFGLGGVLCHILTGEPPFRGAQVIDFIQAAAAGDLSDAFTRLDACGADPELVALCKWCLAPNPADRPDDAGAVASAVSAYRIAAQDRVAQARVDQALAEERRKRRRVQFTLVVAVGLLVIACGVFAWWQEKQTEQNRRNLRTIEEHLKRTEAELEALTR